MKILRNLLAYTNQSIGQYRTDYQSGQRCYSACPTNSLIGNTAIKRNATMEQGNPQESEILILPNPNTGRFTASWEQGKYDYQSLEVFTTLGEKVMTASVVGLQSKEFDLSTFPKGIYILKLKAINGNKTQRILIQ